MDVDDDLVCGGRRRRGRGSQVAKLAMTVSLPRRMEFCWRQEFKVREAAVLVGCELVSVQCGRKCFRVFPVTRFGRERVRGVRYPRDRRSREERRADREYLGVRRGGVAVRPYVVDGVLYYPGDVERVCQSVSDWSDLDSDWDFPFREPMALEE